eukprot:scaffold190487_cov23-Tisochrysis_lutea.AAC.1
MSLAYELQSMSLACKSQPMSLACKLQSMSLACKLQPMSLAYKLQPMSLAYKLLVPGSLAARPLQGSVRCYRGGGGHDSSRAHTQSSFCLCLFAHRVAAEHAEVLLKGERERADGLQRALEDERGKSSMQQQQQQPRQLEESQQLVQDLQQQLNAAGVVFIH